MSRLFKTVLVAGCCALTWGASPAVLRADGDDYWRHYWNWHNGPCHSYYQNNYYGQGYGGYGGGYGPAFGPTYAPAYPGMGGGYMPGMGMGGFGNHGMIGGQIGGIGLSLWH